MYDDPPNPEATRFIQGAHDFFENGHHLLFALVERTLLPYVDTPSFTRVCKALDELYEIGGMLVKGKLRNFERWLTNMMTPKKPKVKLTSRTKDEARLKRNTCDKVKDKS